MIHQITSEINIIKQMQSLKSYLMFKQPEYILIESENHFVDI